MYYLQQDGGSSGRLVISQPPFAGGASHLKRYDKSFLVLC